MFCWISLHAVRGGRIAYVGQLSKGGFVVRFLWRSRDRLLNRKLNAAERSHIGS